MTTYSLYKNNKKVNSIYYNNQIVSCIYKGDDLIYDKFIPGEIIFESSEPGEYNITLPVKGVYEIHVVGAGSGGASSPDKSKYSSRSRRCPGASGAEVIARYFFGSNTVHTIKIGEGGSGVYTLWDKHPPKAGDGGDSSFDRLIVCGGGIGGSSRWNDGDDQEYTYSSQAGTVKACNSYQTLISRQDGNGAANVSGYGSSTGCLSKYEPNTARGKGGDCNCGDQTGYANKGNNGYVKIVFIERYKRIDYDNNQIVYESSTPGDFSTKVTTAGRYKFTVIGGGGGGAADAAGSSGHNSSSTGSSAGAFEGYYDLYEDRDLIITGTIGKGGNGVSAMDSNITAQDGGNSTLLIENELAGTANKGLGGHAWWRSGWESKQGGSGSVSGVLNSTRIYYGDNGVGGTGTGLYTVNPPVDGYSYGCGGSAQSNGNKYARGNNGTNGYVNITFVKRYYVPGLVLFESGTPDDYELVIQNDVRVRIDAVGGGGGYNETAYPYSGTWVTHRAGGGSGGYIYGYRNISEGVYNITIGAGATGATDGFATKVFDEVAGGGHTGWFYANGLFVEEHGGAGGEVDDISSAMTGIPGNTGTTGGTAASTGAASAYLGTIYGRGACKAYNASPGYVKIVVA